MSSVHPAGPKGTAFRHYNADKDELVMYNKVRRVVEVDERNESANLHIVQNLRGEIAA